MRPILHRIHGILFLASVAAGCTAAPPPSSGSRPTGSENTAGSGGTGAPATGGSGGGQAGSGGSGGGTTVEVDAADETPDAATGTTPDADGTTASDAAGSTTDAGAIDDDGGATPMGSDGGPQPSYGGEIPIYYGPEVGPIVKMECPDDPTQGYTEYKDSFHVESPYKVPTNTRFSIIGGIYNMWVFPNDSAHSPIAHGTNPRTEITFGATYDKATVQQDKGNASGIGYFTKGMRMYTADALIESNAKGSIVTQIHTTATGIGPVYLSGGGIPGGKLDQWFNLKIAFDPATLKSQVYINNCPKGTVSGPRGDGHFYFKYGIYHCGSSGGCRDHFKNIHLYIKNP